MTIFDKKIKVDMKSSGAVRLYIDECEKHNSFEIWSTRGGRWALLIGRAVNKVPHKTIPEAYEAGVKLVSKKVKEVTPLNKDPQLIVVSDKDKHCASCSIPLSPNTEAYLVPLGKLKVYACKPCVEEES